MKKIMFVQHIDPTLSAVLKASIAWENTRVWIGTVAGIYQELSKELYQEVSPDVSDEKPFSSGQQARTGSEPRSPCRRANSTTRSYALSTANS